MARRSANATRGSGGNPVIPRVQPQIATSGKPAPGWFSAVSPGDRSSVRELRVRVMSAASCARSGRDPDEWFPVSADVAKARQEAAVAIGVCAGCPVRAACLELSLRHWRVGRHGIWGGLAEAEREALRRLVLLARSGCASHETQNPLERAPAWLAGEFSGNEKTTMLTEAVVVRMTCRSGGAVSRGA
jgi:hypothetical protein